MSDGPIAWVLRAAVAMALMAAVVWLGQIPWGEPGGPAVLRLALRTVQGKLEVCRELSEQERDALPVHMRGSRDCRTHPISYRLRVLLDDQLMIDESVEPGGLRGDRPHNTDREIELAPGSGQLHVSFRPVPLEGADAETTRALAELPRYELRRRIDLEPDRVTLVYLDDAIGALVVAGP